MDDHLFQQLKIGEIDTLSSPTLRAILFQDTMISQKLYMSTGKFKESLVDRKRGGLRLSVVWSHDVLSLRATI
jgi:hypothetical protein